MVAPSQDARACQLSLLFCLVVYWCEALRRMKSRTTRWQACTSTCAPSRCLVLLSKVFGFVARFRESLTSAICCSKLVCGVCTQGQQVRVRDLSAEVRRLQSQLSAEQSARADAEQLIEEKNAELGNNAGESRRQDYKSGAGFRQCAA